MTVALVVSATSTEQLQPIIIHAAQKPRAFPKNFNVESALSEHWYCNKTALMLSSTVFQDWRKEVFLDWTTQQHCCITSLGVLGIHLAR
jgi:hypothetical protein